MEYTKIANFVQYYPPPPTRKKEEKKARTYRQQMGLVQFAFDPGT